MINQKKAEAIYRLLDSQGFDRADTIPMMIKSVTGKELSSFAYSIGHTPQIIDAVCSGRATHDSVRRSIVSALSFDPWRFRNMTDDSQHTSIMQATGAILRGVYAAGNQRLLG
jgi:hypothetical protein